MENIHNIYILSTNKNGNDTNYNFNVYLSNYNINIKPNQDAYLNITGFQSLNTFYNINNKSCLFSVKVYDTITQLNFTYDITIEEGNYDIINFMNVINQLCINYFTMTYDERKNKYTYISNENATKIIYIKPSAYNSKYFGLPGNTYTIIPNGDPLYSSIINMNNWSIIIVKVIGLVEVNKTLDNFNNNIMTKGDICAIVNRQDTAVNALINWSDINNAFQKKISNTDINYLNFQFYNEYNELLTDINDWLLTIRINIKDKV